MGQVDDPVQEHALILPPALPPQPREERAPAPGFEEKAPLPPRHGVGGARPLCEAPEDEAVP
eukprot:5546225-Pyramimonas_sp.AAC.1